MLEWKRERQNCLIFANTLRFSLSLCLSPSFLICLPKKAPSTHPRSPNTCDQSFLPPSLALSLFTADVLTVNFTFADDINLFVSDEKISGGSGFRTDRLKCQASRPKAELIRRPGGRAEKHHLSRVIVNDFPCCYLKRSVKLSHETMAFL